MKQTEGLFGYAYHINQDTDFTVEAGASHNNNDLSGKFIPGNNYAIRDKKTKLIWSLGVRSIWVESGFELYGKVLGEGDGLGFTVGGPMYLTENLAIDLSYTFMKNKHGNDKTKLSALGLSLRSYF
ncbi:hypothetical protein [Vibrio sp. HN007]|uniref:hypothetical protein n=1 Tax=Vibrio iocasae TaxID=3098914 RepID=UPI0035D44A06